MTTIKSSKEDTIASLEDALAIREKQYRKLKRVFEDFLEIATAESHNGRAVINSWKRKAGLLVILFLCLSCQKDSLLDLTDTWVSVQKVPEGIMQTTMEVYGGRYVLNSVIVTEDLLCRMVAPTSHGTVIGEGLKNDQGTVWAREGRLRKDELVFEWVNHKQDIRFKRQ